MLKISDIIFLLTSDEKLFDSVMHDLIEQNLALKATVTNNVELLVFSSRLLPPENWRKLERFCLFLLKCQRRYITLLAH